MIKRVISVILIFFLLAMPIFAIAEGNPPPPSKKNGNFSKKSFSKSNAWSKNGKGTAPPTPGGGGTGGDIINDPISSGLSFLLIGSLIFLMKRVRDEDE